MTKPSTTAVLSPDSARDEQINDEINTALGITLEAAAPTASRKPRDANDPAG